MPKIIIDAGEKTALRAYIDFPLEYVDKRYQAYFVNSACPDQTKITN